MPFGLDFCRGGDFAELGLFSLIFLAGGDDRVLDERCAATHAHDRLADADGLRALRRQQMERLFLSFWSKELPAIELFASERFKNIEKILRLRAGGKQLLNSAKCEVLGLEKGKVFAKISLKSRFLADRCRPRAEMCQIARISEGTLPPPTRTLRARRVPVLGVPFLNPARGKSGVCIGFDDE